MKHILGIGGFLALVVCTAVADFAVRPYRPSAAETALEAALDSASTYPAQLLVARDFREKYPDDMAVQLRVASILAVDNLDSTRAYYQARAESDPGNVVALYLTARLSESPERQRSYAERILAKDKDNYWGLMLLSLSYTPERDPGQKQAEAALRRAIARDNSLPFAVEALGHLLRKRGERAAADDVYKKLATMRPDRFEPVQFRILLRQGDHAEIIRLVDEFLERNPRHVEALYAKARAQRELSDWRGHIATMRRIVAAERSGPHVYDLACAFALAGETDSAFACLFSAVDLGFADLDQYTGDEDLISLRNDGRWSDLLARVDAAEKAKLADFLKQMAATATERKQEALQRRMNALAPDFTLKGLDGKEVTLSKLRGKVVILDFWATWCAPCRKTMPLLDQFYRERKPDNVLVYGVNVWERGGTDKVKPYIEEKGYKFPILYGTADVAKAYGVQGIPTLVVIDKEGKLAYRHVGYDPTLPEVLEWQTKELLK